MSEQEEQKTPDHEQPFIIFIEEEEGFYGIRGGFIKIGDNGPAVLFPAVRNIQVTMEDRWYFVTASYNSETEEWSVVMRIRTVDADPPPYLDVSEKGRLAVNTFIGASIKGVWHQWHTGPIVINPAMVDGFDPENPPALVDMMRADDENHQGEENALR